MTKGVLIYYHKKNKPLLRKKPEGCNATKGRTLKYPGKDIKIIDCEPKSRGRSAK